MEAVSLQSSEVQASVEEVEVRGDREVQRSHCWPDFQQTC